MKARILQSFLLFLLLFVSTALISQVQLQVRVNSGSSGTSCTDGVFGGAPEPHWRVAIAGGGFTTYPSAGICFTNPPNIQYTQIYNCASAYPNQIQVCLRVMEDDGATCIVSEDCVVQLCQNYATPAPGSSATYTLTIPNCCGNSSWGNVNFTISATGSFLGGTANDLICNAVNLGVLNSNSFVGNSGLSNYSNFCATNTADPNPWGGTNNKGVWFRFTTGPFPSSVINFDANSDPQSLGNGIDLQLALYESSNNTCTGALTLVKQEYQGLGLFNDEDMDVNCLKPNTTYFLLVDGENTALINTDGQQGYFGIRINDNGIQQAGDRICDAENLGLVTAGGSVGTPALKRSNICATNTGDPTPGAWGPDKTVWFMFQAPPSGHVLIDANSDWPFPVGTDAIDLQLAVYSTSNNTCTGTLNHIYSDYTPGFLDEDMDVRCLTPGQNYWVMVDGSAINTDGIFDITISDGGQYPAPNDLICNAIPLGQPAPGGTVGLTGQYNYCADNLFEPIPTNWGNDQGIWYTFIAPPSGKVEIRLNDYGLLSPDRIDLQVAVYDLAGAVCTGVPTEIKSEHEGIGVIWDEDMWVSCLIPGREYWILVDGEGSILDPDLQEGIFDIEVYGDPQDPPANNPTPCTALALGNPTGTPVGTTPGALHGSQNNFCMDAIGEPQPSNFTADQTVWYTFVAPSTGAINIQLISDAIIGGVDAINLEVAVYSAPSCAGPFIEEISGSDLTYDLSMNLWCLEPGVTYYMQVDGAPPALIEGHEGYFDVLLTEIPPIPVAGNDTICGAVALGNPWAAPISIFNEHNLCADSYGDPIPNAFGPDQTVWYTFTTPATGGPFAINIQATSDLPWPFGVDAVDLQLAVYESSNNTCTGTLREMNSEYDLTDLFNEFMNVRCLEEGRTYFLMVDGSFVNVQGYFDLNLTPATPVPIPSNDLICNHIDMGTVPLGGTINNGTNYSNFCSDIELGEPNPFAIEQTVWFSFIAPNHVGPNATSNVTVSVLSDPNGVGDLVDLQLAVYSSSNNTCTGAMSLMEFGSANPATTFNANVSVTCLYPGQRYFVQVDGSLINQEGYFTLQITDDGAGVRPTNNMICDAIALGTVPNGGSIINGTNYTNLCTDTEPGEPVPSAFGIGKTVWYTFVAPASGNITIDAFNDPNGIGDEVDLQLAVYSSSDNTCTGSFLEVDSDYDILNKDETIIVDCLEPGRLYFLQVDGSAGILGDEDGWFTLEIRDDGGTSNFPYNNAICSAYNFGTPGAVQTLLAESNTCANVQLGEPGLGTYATHTVWYQFTAPPSGRVEVNVTSTNPITGVDPEIYIYASSNNTCTGTLSLNSSSSWPTAIITETIEATCLVPGQTYFIQIDGSFLTKEGTFDISIEDMMPIYGTGAGGDPQPSNDECFDAIPLTVQPESCLNGAGNFQQFNYGYPTISHNPASVQSCGGNCGDTWYQFVMPSSGSAIIEGNDDGVGPGLGNYSDMTVVAYSGTCMSGLSQLGCGQGGLGVDISFQVAAFPGTIIYVQVFNDNGDDDNELFEICVSEGCGFDNCLEALIVPMVANVPYCFNTAGANADNVSGGAPGYYECSEGDNPEHSLYYYFVSDCNGSDVTLHVMNGVINGTCFLGITPSDGFNISLFQDATPCDNNPSALVDCQSFTSCQVQPINWTKTYTGLLPNTPYIIQIDGGFGSFGGDNSGDIMITTTTSPMLAPTSTPASCSGIADGTATALTIGGAAPFSFLWSNGATDSIATGLSAGTYTVTITGTNGCFDTDTVEVLDGATVVAIPLASVNAICNGDCNGEATVGGMGGVVAAGHSFLWEPAAGSQTTATATGLCAGRYRVTVSDDGGCQDTISLTIGQPTPVDATIPAFLSSGCDSTICVGTATAAGSGGLGAYTYLWSNGATTATATGLCPALYAVTVSDASGCFDSTSIGIATPVASTPPSIGLLSGTYCPNTNLVLTASGGVSGTGSTINWYSGPNGTGALLGVGGSIVYTTSVTDTIYVRREDICGATADSSLVVNVKHYIYATNGTTTNTYCTDNAGWHHFYVGDEIILSVRGDFSGAPAGFPRATIWDAPTYYQQSQGPFTAADCINGWSPGEERFEMDRSWNLDFGGGVPTLLYDVRFYYRPAERTAIEVAAANWMATYPACSYSYKYAYPNGFYFFKNTGINYLAPIFDALHLFGPLNLTNNGVNYVEMGGIPSFSGGSGAVILVPIVLLPVDWLYFDGTTDNKVNYLSWGTESEDNTAHFLVQRSKNGIEFETIGTVAAQGQSSSTKHYQFKDEQPFAGHNYYRLELVDLDGQSTFSNILFLNVISEQTGYAFYPNPTDGLLYYQYEATTAEVLEIEVLDVLGKVLSSREYQATVGMNNISTDLSEYPAGTYMVRVHNNSTGNVHIAKVIKNRF